MIAPLARLRSQIANASRLALVTTLVVAIASCAIVRPLTEPSDDPSGPRQPGETPERDSDEPDRVPRAVPGEGAGDEPDGGEPGEDAPGDAPDGAEPDGDEPAPDAETDAAGPEQDDRTTVPRETPQRDEPAWRELAAGQQGAVRVPVARAVEDPELWRDLWFAMMANRIEPPDPPRVDFSRETVVVLILGERPTGGYAVTIAEVVERRDTVEVVIDVITPEPDAIVTQAITTPYLVAAIPVASKPVRFAGESLEAGFRGD